MNVLCHGIPFCCDNTPLELYEGPHDIRTFGIQEEAEFRYDPLAESACDALERIGKTWRPDLILFWIPEMYPPPMGIEEIPVRTVALVSDWNIYYPILALNLARFDLVLCDKPGLAVFQNEYVSPQHLFPLYSQVSTIHKPYPGEKDLDVVFVGNLNPAAHTVRGRYLERLAGLADDYRVAIAGGILGEDYGRLLSRARIVFNHSIRGELNLRVFETFACRSLAFLEEDNLEAGDWFEDGREVVFYNWGNFEERVRHYLGHPEQADAIAARGYARANEFAGEVRFTQLVDWCMAQEPGTRRFFDLPPAERQYQTFLMYAGCRFPEYHQLEPRLMTELLQDAPSDPRVWAAVGHHFTRAYSQADSEEQREQRAVKAFAKALELDPESVPYAFNVASSARAFGMTQVEIDFLERGLSCHSMDGAETIIGSHGDTFWARWRRAVAERTASVEMLKAEAHIRLARICTNAGGYELAEEHLRSAHDFDPENAGGAHLLSELCWASGRKEEAAAAFQKRLPDLPLNAQMRARLIEMLRALGRDGEALELEEQEARMQRIFVNAPPV